MSGQDDRDFDELLRRLLHEEADLVEPAEDALEQIQNRLGRPRPSVLAWATVVLPAWFRQARSSLRPAWTWLRKVVGAAYARFPATARMLRRWRSPAVLTLALGAAVVAGVLALTPLPRQAVSGTAALFRSLEGHRPASGTGGQTVAGSGASPLPAGTAGPTTGPGSHRHRATPSAGTTSVSSPEPSPCSTPAASPSPEPSPSPSPSSGSSSTPAVRQNVRVCPNPAGGTSPAPTATSSPTPTPTPDPTAGPTPTGDPTTAPAGDPTTAPA